MTWNDSVNDVDIVELELFGVTLCIQMCVCVCVCIFAIAHTYGYMAWMDLHILA